jgi:hypothetical protein
LSQQVFQISETIKEGWPNQGRVEMSVIPELVELTDAEIDAVAGGCIAPGLDANPQ